MKPAAPRTIALIEWNWMGHHPAYAVQLALAMAQAGLEVVPFCADPQDFEQRLAQQQRAFPPAAGGRIHRAEQIYRAPARLPGPWRLRAIDQAVHHFGFLGKLLRRWGRKRGQRIDAACFACIYDQEFEFFAYGEPLFRFPWTGLYLNSRFFRLPGTLIPFSDRPSCPQKIFRLHSCRGVALLDPGVEAPMRQLLGPGKAVVRIPDFTDASLHDPEAEPAAAESPHHLALKLRDFAQGRPIVSLVGHLQRTKGLVAFTEAASCGAFDDVFFFLGGAINWHQIDGATQGWLLRQWEQRRNIYTHLQRLKRESSLNRILVQSDLIFAAYSDFPNSSNIVSKAALLRRPVLVSQGHRMAEVVEHYGLGECVPEGDGTALRACLRRMLQPGYREQLARRARWQDYAEHHDRSLLPEALRHLIQGD
jgi:hypothetical protein